jgi:hypothetical protein
MGAGTEPAAAPNVLDGTVIGRNMQRHRHQEFIRFLNTIEPKVPVEIHVIAEALARKSGGPIELQNDIHASMRLRRLSSASPRRYERST